MSFIITFRMAGAGSQGNARILTLEADHLIVKVGFFVAQEAASPMGIILVVEKVGDFVTTKQGAGFHLGT